MTNRCAFTNPILLSWILLLAAGLTASAQTNKPAKLAEGFAKTSDGIQIHYVDSGGRGAFSSSAAGQVRPVILFVPGWTMPGWIWEKQIEELSKTYRVVAMDPRAQGESTKTPDGLYPEMRARDIKVVIDQLHLKPVVLVGWSMAVEEIAAFVDQFGTEGIAGIVLVDGIAGGFSDSPALPSLLKFAAAMQKDRAKFTDSFVRSMYRKPQGEDYFARVVKASLETPTSAALALFLGSFMSDFRPALAKFNVPTVLAVTQGGPMDAIYKEMAEKIPGVRLEIFAECGHALFVDDAEHFNRMLAEFVASLK